MSQVGLTQNDPSVGKLEETPVSWYVKELTDLRPEARELFEKYSNVEPNEVVSHIQQFRDEAFAIFPYPCLGRWGFLDLSISQSPSYSEVLDRVKKGELLLDIGCCVGQDLRKLIHDGAPSGNTYGSDLKSSFWNIGYDLFLDKASLKTKFIEADIFDANSGLQQLDSRVDIVHAASFFHLFDWDQQVQAAKRTVQLLRPVSGSLIIGRQAGTIQSRDFEGTRLPGNKRYSHNPESLARMWKQVGDETGTEWTVDATFGDQNPLERMGGSTDPSTSDVRWLYFAIRRV
ncbi:hypothetical protein P153DRAFT_296666 [Dothidotthia symphoricarpi CBS 119687]|uniref:Methyltransferase domain-containing protein n=1 Tax=Dothidotthia symphoricarpi CBS 119687 TaxID=1392245 RepID=A0A6A6A802_9PLEO|nr:uncharacterized protein P153DRAFT_296666 [Dothidotthia symphoricarpi CBS 119687]KAF2126781.1 hypothetical protein P153DRAFT_296666 [Dothidotthia symphoricarpi CBS 119687]